MRTERPLSRVPRAILALLIAAVSLQVGWQLARPRPEARAEALTRPPATAALRAYALGEPLALAQLMTLYLQAFDNQPGVSIPFRSLDYERVVAWLTAILDLDPLGQYPLLMASQLYSQVPDRARQLAMCEFVYREFRRDPDRRWRWLAHCAIIVKHRLSDPRRALEYAEAITREARGASHWARQMRIFMLEDLGEPEAAAILLGGLLASGEITDPKEVHFLTERLKALRGDGTSSGATKN
ncbi:MAG: hypothetical protein IT529_03015 [Burkholderiales bacterium]|nr:hypothetical protein [Burkholderiales bacterium]